MNPSLAWSFRPFPHSHPFLPLLTLRTVTAVAGTGLGERKAAVAAGATGTPLSALQV